ncbi:MAG: hypothetical protein V2A77_00775 [Pseudomonadota bacterium]
MKRLYLAGPYSVLGRVWLVPGGDVALGAPREEAKALPINIPVKTGGAAPARTRRGSNLGGCSCETCRRQNPRPSSGDNRRPEASQPVFFLADLPPDTLIGCASIIGNAWGDYYILSRIEGDASRARLMLISLHSGNHWNEGFWVRLRLGEPPAVTVFTLLREVLGHPSRDEGWHVIARLADPKDSVDNP